MKDAGRILHTASSLVVPLHLEPGVKERFEWKHPAKFLSNVLITREDESNLSILFSELRDRLGYKSALVIGSYPAYGMFAPFGTPVRATQSSSGAILRSLSSCKYETTKLGNGCKENDSKSRKRRIGLKAKSLKEAGFHKIDYQTHIDLNTEFPDMEEFDIVINTLAVNSGVDSQFSNRESSPSPRVLTKDLEEYIYSSTATREGTHRLYIRHVPQNCGSRARPECLSEWWGGAACVKICNLGWKGGWGGPMYLCANVPSKEAGAAIAEAVARIG